MIRPAPPAGRILLGFALALTASALLADEFQLHLLAEILLLGTAVMSLDLLVGFGGLTSLSHAALFGTAGYAAAIASQAFGAELFLLLAVGVIAGALGGAMLGLLTARSNRLFLLVLSLLLGQIVWEIAFNWRDLTGGADGLRGLPVPTLFGQRIGGTHSFFLVAGGLAMASLALILSFVAAPIGRALTGTREQPMRMQALGYGIPDIRLRAMLAAGAVAGGAGALYPFLNQYIGPQSVHWSQSAAMIVMLVIGGVGSLWGAYLGCAVYLLIQTYVSSWTDRWQLCVGLVFVGTVLLLPGGLASSARRLLRRGLRGTASRP